MQVALAKIAIDLGLFRTLKESEAPLSLAQLAEKTGASPKLLGKYAALAIMGLSKSQQGAFFAHKLHLASSRRLGPRNTLRVHSLMSLPTPMLLVPLHSCMSHSSTSRHSNEFILRFDISGPCTQLLPDYLAETGYQEIVSNKECPFQKAFQTSQTLFEWMPQHPKHMKSLGHLMALQRPTVWVDHFPVLEQLGEFPGPDKTLMVDIGGGFGQQSKALRSKCPSVEGRIIVQDMPQTLASAEPAEGVEFAEHDFFQPQPVEGAKFYYLRHVLHDWPDEQCVQILQQVIPAMAPESRILIDEVVIPVTGVPWQAAFMDLLMMESFASIERTRAEWEALMDKAGLKIIEEYHYDGKEQAILVVIPK